MDRFRTIHFGLRRWIVPIGVIACVAFAAASLQGGDAASARAMPVAVDDSLSTLMGQQLKVPSSAIVGNDTDASGLGTTLISPPTHGRIPDFATNGPGAFTYMANDENFHGGEDHLTYCLAVANGTPCISNIATIEIVISPPRTLDDAYSTPTGSALDVRVGGALTNDIDATGLSWNAQPNTAHGTIDFTCAGPIGTFCYKPTPGFVGVDAFTYCLSLIAGHGCVSDSATVRIRVGGPAVSRIGGVDRFDVAAGVAEQTHPAGASTVFIASGGNYPDALSAAPAANHAGGALLLVTADAIPGRTQDALSRLAPSKVVIVGGPNTISDRVASELGSLLPGATVSRIGGADRFAVSRAVAKTVFGTAAQAIIATGANYPDALSSGGAAAIVDEPVVLVNGGLTTADADTLSVLGGLGTATLVISGGPNSISTGLEASLRTIATVTRVGGADRFEASVNINKASFTTATTAFLATGFNYPDALVGGVIAGKNRGPLYVVQTNCVPQATLDDIARIGATKVVLLGGTNSLSERVFNLVPCA